MKRVLLALAFGLLLAYGCLTQDEGDLTKEELRGKIPEMAESPSSGLITVSGDANLSVVKIEASRKGAGWQFPIEDHEDEFIRIGLHSDSFIRLNSSQLMFLDEEEAIWLHPMAEGNGTVLFDAIYSRDIDNCSADAVRLLGKDYGATHLVNGSTFESDDKWKVGLEKKYGCLERIVIYLDGYFYDLGEGDQISLFRNDNTILFVPDSSGGAPAVRIIGTAPS